MQIPTNLDEAYKILDELLGEKGQEAFLDKQQEYYGFWRHHTLGQYIRNEWKLWIPDTVFYNYFKDTFDLDHADDMSGIILDGYEAYLNAEDFDPWPEVAKYKEHWKNIYDNQSNS